MSRRASKVVLSSALSVFVLAGCGGAGMKVPSDFGEGMKEMSTKGRGSKVASEKGFEFGPYSVSDVERGESSKSGWDVIDGFAPAREGGFRYHFAGGADRSLIGKCAPAKGEKAGEFSIGDELEAVGCTCQKGTESVAHLFVEDLAGEYAGPVVVGDVEVRATGIYRLANDKQLKVPAGYRVDDEGGAVGGVQVLPGKSTAWIRGDLRKLDRQGLACLFAGLMLYIPSQKKDD
jgi:hypothetical protein